MSDDAKLKPCPFCGIGAEPEPPPRPCGERLDGMARMLVLSARSLGVGDGKKMVLRGMEWRVTVEPKLQEPAMSDLDIILGEAANLPR